MSDERPLRHLTIAKLEGRVRTVTTLDELKGLRSELAYRRTKRAGELDDLIARLIRSWTGSFDPKAR